MAEEQAAHVEENGTFDGDPMDAIRAEDARRQASALETELAQRAGEQLPDDGGDVTETEAATSEQETSRETSVRRAPIDETLRALETSNLTPEQREAIRATIATNTRLQQEKSGVDQRIENAVQQAMSQIQQPQQEYVEDGPMGQVTPEQRELFENIAKDLGFVKRQDLDMQKMEESRESYLQQGRERAVQEYGNYVLRDESGELVIPDEVRTKIQGRMDPIKQNGGTLSLADMVQLAFHDELLNDAFEKGKAEGQRAGTARRVERVGAQVESSTAGLPPVPKIRGQKGSKADDRDAVFARAAALAKGIYSKSR